MTEPPVASPCVGVCELDPASGYCRGCLRTVDEIAGWRDADDRARHAILARLAARRAAGFVTITKRGRPSAASATDGSRTRPGG